MQVVRPLAHADTIAHLWRAAREGRLPHALLFEGPAGIGKYQAAKWFALGCLCERGPGEPCLVCGPCKRVLSGDLRSNHPDVFVLDPEDPALARDFESSTWWKVHRIAYRPDASFDDLEHCVERALDLCMAEGRARLLLLRESQRMNEAAQNALLKTLEEPRPGTVLVLETHRRSQLLPTLRSRCVRIRFEPLGLAECEHVLVEAGLAPEAARELARSAGGAPGLALAQERQGLRELRRALGDAASGARDALDVAREVWELPGEFTGSTPTAKERERTRVTIDLALALLRDALRLRAGVDAAELAHGEHAARVAGELAPRELERRAAALCTARADVERNLAPASVLERALLTLARGAPAAPAAMGR